MVVTHQRSKKLVDRHGWMPTRRASDTIMGLHGLLLVAPVPGTRDISVGIQPNTALTFFPPGSHMPAPLPYDILVTAPLPTVTTVCVMG